MKKIIKNILIFFIPIFFLTFIIFSYNVIKINFRHGAQSSLVYQHPYPWQKELVFAEIKRFSNKILQNYYPTNFQKINFFLNERSERRLLSKTPGSAKSWVDAKLINNNKNLQEIKLKYRGDNPSNWLRAKKSFKIKTKKNQLINGNRNISYHLYDVEKFIPFIISQKMDILSQKANLVEVYINGEIKGLYVEHEKIDELFLRQNSIMPVNIYKGENHTMSFYIGLNNNLFNNPGVWSKLANFNQNKASNNDDLKFFLETLNSNHSNLDSSLKNHIDLDEMSKLQAMLTITQNSHNDWFHNMRLISDPWNGNITQLIIDPEISEGRGASFLDFSSNDLNAFLNKNADFIHKKYFWLYNYLVNENVVSYVEEYYKNVKEDLTKIEKKEPYNFQKLNYTEKFENVINVLKNNRNKILKLLESEPAASWNKTGSGFEVHVDKHTPVTDLKVSFLDSEVPKWIGLDLNYDNSISKDEPKFFIGNNFNTISAPVALYANRIKKTSKTGNIEHDYSIYTTKTKFNFISERKIKPIAITNKNFLTKKIYNLKKEIIQTSANANKYNKLIFTEEVKKNTITLTGNILVNEDLIFENPVIIKKGTIFSIEANKNIIFKNKVIAKGSASAPIIFKKNNLQNAAESWGTVALLGKKSADSILDHVMLSGGSGSRHNQFLFSSMLSIHNTSNVQITNIDLSKNKKFDDVLHIVYCNDLLLENIRISNAFSDAIDIDVSKNIIIKNIQIESPVNDGLDFMETTAVLHNVMVSNSKDKGVSIGENSNIIINDSDFSNNNIGIAIKDKSKAKIYNSNLINNKVQIAAYAKNWKYGDGGSIEIYDSNLNSRINTFTTLRDPDDINLKTNKNLNQNSKISIFNSRINGRLKFNGKNISIK